MPIGSKSFYDSTDPGKKKDVVSKRSFFRRHEEPDEEEPSPTTQAKAVKAVTAYSSAKKRRSNSGAPAAKPVYTPSFSAPSPVDSVVAQIVELAGRVGGILSQAEEMAKRAEKLYRDVEEAGKKAEAVLTDTVRRSEAAAMRSELAASRAELTALTKAAVTNAPEITTAPIPQEMDMNVEMESDALLGKLRAGLVHMTEPAADASNGTPFKAPRVDISRITAFSEDPKLTDPTMAAKKIAAPVTASPEEVKLAEDVVPPDHEKMPFSVHQGRVSGRSQKTSPPIFSGRSDALAQGLVSMNQDSNMPRVSPFIMDIPPSGDHYSDSRNDIIVETKDHVSASPRKRENIIN